MKPDYEDTLIYLKQYFPAYFDKWGGVIAGLHEHPRQDRQNLINEMITVQKYLTAREAEAFKGLRETEQQNDSPLSSAHNDWVKGYTKGA
jgi:hypothetical protein